MLTVMKPVAKIMTSKGNFSPIYNLVNGGYLGVGASVAYHLS